MGWGGKVLQGDREGLVHRGQSVLSQNLLVPGKSLFTECGGYLIALAAHISSDGGEKWKRGEGNQFPGHY